MTDETNVPTPTPEEVTPVATEEKKEEAEVAVETPETPAQA